MALIVIQSRCIHIAKGRAIAQAVRPRFPPRRPGFKPSSGHVGFVVNKVALGQVLSHYIDFPCQFSFHSLLHTHHLSSGVGIISQLFADVPNPKKLHIVTSGRIKVMGREYGRGVDNI
jgi:hypothetical protein